MAADGADGREHEPIEQEPDRRRGVIAGAALATVVAVVLALLILDLWVLRPAGQREFIRSNIECLRCHTDMIPRRAQVSVHQPFIAGHCTSCHTPHGYADTPMLKPAEMGPRWLQVRLEQLGLRVVWDLLVALRITRSSGVAPTSSKLLAGGPSHLVTPEAQLCWTCHGNLAPQRLEAVQHQPFATGHCASCHDPHASDTKPLLRSGTADLCVACHRIGPELLASDVHPPFRQRRCTTCHAPHASAVAGLLVASQRTLCFRCHADIAALASEPVQHDPFVTRCTGCHSPHSASFTPLLAVPQPYLCYRCHPGVQAEFAQVSRHPVPSRLICTDCHQPHAAPVRGLLPVAQRELCLGCHTSVGAELTKAVVHYPVGRGDCTQCHAPHGAPVRPLLPVADPALCRRCHAIPALPVRSPAPFRSIQRPPKIPLGPATVPGAKRPVGFTDPSAHPGPRYAKSKGDTSHRLARCEDCHRAHSSDYAHLTVAPGDKLCLGCHARDVPRFTASAHAGLSCMRCHTPHNAGPYLLRGGNPQVCLGCHPGFTQHGRYHPADARYYDYVAGEPMTCTSTCHDPHGSRYASMLRLPYNSDGFGSDYLCLVCHTQVEKTY